jgi:hypothetical protein
MNKNDFQSNVRLDACIITMEVMGSDKPQERLRGKLKAMDAEEMPNMVAELETKHLKSVRNSSTG